MVGRAKLKLWNEYGKLVPEDDTNPENLQTDEDDFADDFEDSDFKFASEKVQKAEEQRKKLELYQAARDAKPTQQPSNQFIAQTDNSSIIISESLEDDPRIKEIMDVPVLNPLDCDMRILGQLEVSEVTSKGEGNNWLIVALNGILKVNSTIHKSGGEFLFRTFKSTFTHSER